MGSTYSIIQLWGVINEMHGLPMNFHGFFDNEAIALPSELPVQENYAN
jgi:hypothetical protein